MGNVKIRVYMLRDIRGNPDMLVNIKTIKFTGLIWVNPNHSFLCFLGSNNSLFFCGKSVNANMFFFCLHKLNNPELKSVTIPFRAYLCVYGYTCYTVEELNVFFSTLPSMLSIQKFFFIRFWQSS